MDAPEADVADAPEAAAVSLADCYAAMRAEASCIGGGPAGFFRRREALRSIEAECGTNTVFPIIAIREQAAFVAFYADYHFTKRFGKEPGAGEFVDGALLCLLNRLHEAIAHHDVLPEAIRRALFATACAVYGGDDISAAAC